jgi:hypothetical protein
MCQNFWHFFNDKNFKQMKPACSNLHNKAMYKACRFHNG